MNWLTHNFIANNRGSYSRCLGFDSSSVILLMFCNPIVGQKVKGTRWELLHTSQFTASLSFERFIMFRLLSLEQWRLSGSRLSWRARAVRGGKLAVPRIYVHRLTKASCCSGPDSAPLTLGARLSFSSGLFFHRFRFLQAKGQTISNCVLPSRNTPFSSPYPPLYFL